MEDEMKAALESEFGGQIVERDADYDMYGMFGFDVEGDKYIIGDYDTAREAAIKEAEQAFEDCYSDEDKIKWLDAQGWPGLDEESIMEDISSDYEDDEEGNPFEGMDWSEYIAEFGINSVDWSFVSSYVNTRELGEYVVDCDGIANGLARYDGNEIDCGDFLAFRVD